MLNLAQIQAYYPDKLKDRERFVLREYLQHLILQIVFDSPFAQHLSFLGGTALRIVYDNQRFSEDIDFDFFHFSEDQFVELSEYIHKNLEKEGFQVETKNVFKNAFRCYIRLPGLLFNQGVTTEHREKILIQLDAAAHGFMYKPDRKLLDKFDIFTEIFVTPIDILLSQKINALLNRKRAKGRDFFDVGFLLARTQPNYDYLQQKLEISDANMLKKKLLEFCDSLDLKQLAEDVEPFLFNPQDARRVILFKEIVSDQIK